MQIIQIVLFLDLICSFSLSFQGTTAQQDTRFSDKKKKLLKTMKFGDGIDRKVSMAYIIFFYSIVHYLECFCIILNVKTSHDNFRGIYKYINKLLSCKVWFEVGSQ